MYKNLTKSEMCDQPPTNLVPRASFLRDKLGDKCEMPVDAKRDKCDLWTVWEVRCCCSCGPFHHSRLSTVERRVLGKTQASK